MSTNPLTTGKGKPVTMTKEQIVDHGNAKLEELGRHDVEWRISKTGQLYITLKDDRPHYVSLDVMDRRGEPMTEADTFKLNVRLEKEGATARYRKDGSRYFPGLAA